MKSIELHFDMSSEFDAQTYARLGESARRADCPSRGMQAKYLLSLMLGIRPFSGMRLTGLEELPDFTALQEAFEDLGCEAIGNLESRIKKIEDDLGLTAQKRPNLRLVKSASA